LCFAASAILGGLILDHGNRWTGLQLGGLWLSFFPCLFIFGWIVRSLGALLLLWVIEPVDSRAKTPDRDAATAVTRNRAKQKDAASRLT
jgi:hypothetical protein